jgi:hypothetical protein
MTDCSAITPPTCFPQGYSAAEPLGHQRGRPWRCARLLDHRIIIPLNFATKFARAVRAVTAE